MVARSCIGCGVVIPRGYRCKQCQPPPKRANAAYKSAAYLRNRRAMIAAAWRLGSPCWLCGRSFASQAAITADHIIPLSRGGTHELANLAPAHQRCNSSRQASGQKKMP